ncbi:MAG: SanA/YdcF family protein [Cyclobacteriaceae bacterium]
MRYLNKLLKIFLSIIFWITVVFITIVIIYYKDANKAWEAMQSVNPEKHVSFLLELLENFSNMDSWNMLYTSFLISVLLILFFVTDQWIKSVLNKVKARIRIRSKRKKKNRYYDNEDNPAPESKPVMIYSLLWAVSKVVVTILVIAEFVLLTNAIIFFYAVPRVKSNPDNLREARHALLLGTNKKLRTKEGDNLYYIYRINATVELYKSGKVDKIVISGDNTGDYNEPQDMMNDLVRRGVPKRDIEIDYAGFRTLDSMVRLRYHFGVEDVIVISQLFHLERALFLGWFYGVDVQGFQAEGDMTKRMWQREALAKPKVILDIFVMNIQPRYGRTEERIQLDFEDKNHQVLIGAAFTLLFFGIIFFVYSFLPKPDKKKYNEESIHKKRRRKKPANLQAAPADKKNRRMAPS